MKWYIFVLGFSSEFLNWCLIYKLNILFIWMLTTNFILVNKQFNYNTEISKRRKLNCVNCVFDQIWF